MSDFVFSSRRRVERLDWRRLASVDIDRIQRDLDFATLQEHVRSVAWCDADAEFDARRCDPNLLKLFKLSQLIIEYLVKTQEYLTHSQGQAERQLQEAKSEAQALKQRLADKQREANDLKRECHKRKKLLIAQQQLMESGPQSYQQCPYCPKAFLNNAFLRSHIGRRHGGLESSQPGAERDEFQVRGDRVGFVSQLTREELVSRQLQQHQQQALSAEVQAKYAAELARIREAHERQLREMREEQELLRQQQDQQQKQKHHTNLGELMIDDEAANNNNDGGVGGVVDEKVSARRVAMAAAGVSAAGSSGRRPQPQQPQQPQQQPEDDVAAVSAQMRLNLDLMHTTGSHESLLQDSLAQGADAMRTSGLLARLKTDRGILEGLKGELTQLLEEQLEERGIAPGTTRIANRVLNEKLAMLAREREQVAFKFTNFDEIRRKHAARVDVEARRILAANPVISRAQQPPQPPQPPQQQQQQAPQRPSVRVSQPAHVEDIDEDDDVGTDEDDDDDEDYDDTTGRTPQPLQQQKPQQQQQQGRPAHQTTAALVHAPAASGSAAAAAAAAAPATAVQQFDDDEEDEYEDDEEDPEDETRTGGEDPRRYPETAVSATAATAPARPPPPTGVPSLYLGRGGGASTSSTAAAAAAAAANASPSPRLPRVHHSGQQQPQRSQHQHPSSNPGGGSHGFDSPDGAGGTGGSRHPQQRLSAEASSSWDSQGDEISELNAGTAPTGGARPGNLKDEVADLLQQLDQSPAGHGGLNLRASAQTDNSNTLNSWAVTTNVVSTVNPGVTGRSMGTNKSSDIGEDSFDD